MSEKSVHGLLARARWSRPECTAIRKLLDPPLTAEELDQAAIYCNATGLEILADQVYMTRRKSKERVYLTFEPTIEGYRAVAALHGDYVGQGNPEWFDREGEIYEVWFSSEPPAAARVAVYRRGEERPTIGVARYDSYVQTSNGKPAGNWATMPEVMLAAAAERQALSKSFPILHVRGDGPMPLAEPEQAAVEEENAGNEE